MTETFGQALKRWREAAGMSQRELGRLVHMSGANLCRIENHKQPAHETIADQLDEALGAHGALKATLPPSTLSPQQPDEPGRSSRTTRRSAELGFPPMLAAHSARHGKIVAPQGAAAEFTAQITVESPVPTRIGWTDVEQVRVATRMLAASENLFGGGLSCEAAASQLRWASRLIDAQATTKVRHAMFEAVGNLAGVVAFSVFDIGDHNTAAECFDFALWCAEQGQSWALRAATLSDMSRQAVYLGDHDGALSHIEFAQVRADRLSATGRAMIWALHARLLAIMGRHAEARVQVRRADDFFAERDPEADPPWLIYYNEAEHQGSTARALTPLALAEGEVGEAAERSRAAIRLHSNNYPRSRTFSKVRLATLLMAVDDPRTAAAIGHEAAADASSLHSRRIAKELSILDKTARRHRKVPEVADLRSSLAAALTRI